MGMYLHGCVYVHGCVYNIDVCIVHMLLVFISMCTLCVFVKFVIHTFGMMFMHVYLIL